MMHKTQELDGELLDRAVAKALGWELRDWHLNPSAEPKQWFDHNGGYAGYWYDEFSPSTDWWAGGPIIEREAIGCHPVSDATWLACKHITGSEATGPTPLIAAMRAYVISKLGDEVDL